MSQNKIINEKLFKIAKSLIFISLIIIPFINYGEILALFRNDIIGTSKLYIHPIFKLIKDILIVLIFCVILFCIYIENTIISIEKYLLFLVITLIIILGIVNLDTYSILLILAGLKFSFFFILLLIFSIYKRSSELLPSESIIKFMLLINLIMQLIQFFWGGNFYGVNENGFALRSPGIFLIPNTSGFFSICCLAYLLFIYKINTYNKIFYLAVAGISCYLTLSGVAIILWSIIVFINFFEHINVLLTVIISVIIILLLFTQLDFITGRGERYTSISLGTRLDILFTYINHINFITMDFGKATQIAYLLNLESAQSDSTFSAIIVNYGFFGFLLLIFFIFYFLILIIKNNDKTLLVLYIVLFQYMLFTSVPEAYPMNLMLALGIGSIFSKNSNIK